jgi:hypothetical protein
MRARSLTLILAIVFGLGLGSSGQASIDLDISSAIGATVEFKGTGTGATFVFNNNRSGQGFEVTMSSSGGGPNSAVGLFGTLGGTYSYTKASIVSFGKAQEAPVISTGGKLTITDASMHSLTGTISGVDVTTLGTGGSVDLNGIINLTNVSYSGTNHDLKQLKAEAAVNGGVVAISFQFIPGKSLTQLAANKADNKTSYSGSIATVFNGASVPEPSSLVIAGLGALGFIAYGWRKRCQSLI